MFRTVFPSVIRSLRLYIQHQVYVIHVQVLWLLASVNEMEHLVHASKLASKRELSSISFPLAISHRTCMTYLYT